MIPIEVFTMLGGALSGFVFKYAAERAKERQEQFKLYIQRDKLAVDVADAAAKRNPGTAGRWIRRLIVVTVMVGVVVLPFIAPLLDVPIIVEVQRKTHDILFGLFSFGGTPKFIQLDGFLLIDELRHTLLAIVGYYFGHVSAKVE